MGAYLAHMRFRIHAAAACFGTVAVLTGCTSNAPSAEEEVCRAFDSLASAADRYGSIAEIPDSTADNAWERISGAGASDDDRFAEIVRKIDYQGGNQLLLAVSEGDLEYAQQVCEALGYDIISPLARHP